MYLKEFGELIQKFHEIEKASSENFGEVSDNTQKLKITSNLEITHVSITFFTLLNH